MTKQATLTRIPNLGEFGLTGSYNHHGQHGSTCHPRLSKWRITLENGDTLNDYPTKKSAMARAAALGLELN